MTQKIHGETSYRKNIQAEKLHGNGYDTCRTPGYDIKRSVVKTDIKNSDDNSLMAKAKAVKYNSNEKFLSQTILRRNCDSKKSDRHKNDISQLIQNMFHVKFKK